MGRLATPIYNWAFELMQDDLIPANTIADIGCGNGLMSYRCSRSLEAKSYALLDRSEAQLVAGEGLHRKMRRRNEVTTHVAPAESIPLEDGAYDVVYTTGSINLWSDPVQGLRECKRVVRPGGVLWLFDQGPCDSIGLVLDAVFRQRIFGLGIPGYSMEAVIRFAEEAGLDSPRIYPNKSLYGLRWVVV
jgi:ubiquinone/menaquinone biosynthesis C-methylase UbiE